MNPKLKEKLLESLMAVLPITLIVLALSVALVPMDVGTAVMFTVGAVCFCKLLLLAFPADLLVFIVDGLCLLEVLRLLNQLLELLNSRFPRFHSTTDFACLVMDSGQGCIQFFQRIDTFF